MVSIRLKVGPRGQIVMPKKSKEELIKEPLEWKHKRVRGNPAKLGELKRISLEDEFDDVWRIGE